MQNFKFLILLIFLSFNSAYAFNYTEEDKNMFYDAFIDGYVTEMAKAVNQLEIEQNKKDAFMSALKQNINKNDLINSSWNCIQSYPIEQIVTASVLCTSNWTNSQTEKNKKLFDLLK